MRLGFFHLSVEAHIEPIDGRAIRDTFVWPMTDERLLRVTAPTVVRWGKDDGTNKAWSRRITRAAIRFLPRRHVRQHESPTVAGATLRRFLG
jgi:pimeloyl-ACP methyl ester carboxylesterase